MSPEQSPQVLVRRAVAGDLAAIAQVQAESLAAAQWDVAEYLSYDLIVAACEDRIAGFAVTRRVAEGESELLNLAVDTAFRRRGIGRRLFAALAAAHPGDLWLEVRESNRAARSFYQNLGWREAGLRPQYYGTSGEAAIVMNFHS